LFEPYVRQRADKLANIAVPSIPMNGKKKRWLLMKPNSTNVLDYSCMMSMYEKESLAAEAKLNAEREKQKPPKRTVHN
jgi:hypothetical protein